MKALSLSVSISMQASKLRAAAALEIISEMPFSSPQNQGSPVEMSEIRLKNVPLGGSRLDGSNRALERLITMLGKVLRILHHLNDINGDRGTHNHAGPRRIGIDRQHAGHSDRSCNDSCREYDRDLAHLALLSIDRSIAPIARVLLPMPPCSDRSQPSLACANRAGKYGQHSMTGGLYADYRAGALRGCTSRRLTSA